MLNPAMEQVTVANLATVACLATEATVACLVMEEATEEATKVCLVTEEAMVECKALEGSLASEATASLVTGALEALEATVRRKKPWMILTRYD